MPAHPPPLPEQSSSSEWSRAAQLEVARRDEDAALERKEQSEKERSYADAKLILLHCLRTALGMPVRHTIQFRVALWFTLLVFPLWWFPNWWESVLNVLSLLIGFSISGLGMVCSFGDARFRKLIGPKDAQDERPPYLMMTSEFTFFVLLQFASLTLALVCKAFYQPQWFDRYVTFYSILTYLGKALWGFAFFFFSWSLSTGIGAALYLYRLTKMQVTVDCHALKNKLED